MMPVMMAAIVPAMIVSYMPTIKLEGAMVVLPVANVVVLIRELLLGNYDVSAIIICLLSTCFYAAAAVVVANKLYGHEAVLFSDVGSYKALLLRRFLRPRDYPPASLALLVVALIFPINFYVQSSLLDVDSSPLRFDLVIIGTQLLLFALPVFLLAWYSRLDIRRTFSLRLPGAKHFVGAVLMAASIVPVTSLLQQIQFHFFPPSEVGAEFMKQQMRLFEGQSLACVLLVIALMPAICEEILFRGFLLGGLRERLSVFQTALVVGLIFGLYHMYVEKIVIVALLGMVLSLVCIRSGSIYLAMLVHLANNGLSAASIKVTKLQEFFGLVTEETMTGIRFDWKTGAFLVTFVVGLALIALTRSSRDKNQQLVVTG